MSEDEQSTNRSAEIASDDDAPLNSDQNASELDERPAKRARTGRPGVVFVSRLPPNMRPKHLRDFLRPYGALGRVYCALECAIYYKNISELFLIYYSGRELESAR